MATSAEFIDYVLELLEGVGHVHVRRMFGGALLRVGDTQLGIIIDDELYFKVTDYVLQQRFAGEGAQQFSYVRKGKTNPVVIKNWWTVPERYLDDHEALTELAAAVLAQPEK